MNSMESMNRTCRLLREQHRGAIATLWDAAQRLWRSALPAPHADRPHAKSGAMRAEQREAADPAARALALKKRATEKALRASGHSLASAKREVARLFAHTSF